MRLNSVWLLFALFHASISFETVVASYGTEEKLNDLKANLWKGAPSGPNWNEMTKVVAQSLQDPKYSENQQFIQCLDDIVVFLGGLTDEQEWAFAAADSYYRKQAGIFDGAFHWLGSYDECMRSKATGSWVNTTVPGLGPIQRRHDFDMKYCRSWYSLWEISASVGTCVPSSCSRMNVSILLTLLGDLASPVTYTYCGEKPELGSDGGAITAIVILSLFGALVFVATAVDIVKNWMTNKKPNSENISEDDTGQQNHAYERDTESHRPVNSVGSETTTRTFRGATDTPMENGITPGKGMANTFNLERNNHNMKEGLGMRLLLSFSFRCNLSRVLSTSQPPGSFTCMYGVRFLSMTWILLGHTWQLGLYVLPGIWNYTLGAENAFAQYLYQRRFTHTLINQVGLAVQVFFLLSGCLVTHSFMRLLSKWNGKPGIQQMVLYYIHRYWRLTPAYAIILMTYANLFVYFINGPLLPEDFMDASACKSSWWRNILYINSIPFDEFIPCMGWSWYLGNDFLFYLVVPVFALLLFHVPVIGIIVLILGFFGTLIIRIVLLAVLDTNNFGIFMTHIYTPPWTNFGSYAIGMGLGYMFYYTKCKFKLHKVVLVVGWIIAIAFAVLSISGSYKRECPEEEGCWPWSDALSVAYQGTFTSVFGLSVAWVILVCCCGQGGFVNTFLSWNFFVPLSRLTYVGYLIHPIIIYLYVYTRRRMIYVDDFTMIMQFCGTLSLTVVASFFLTLIFEIPFLNLEKVILPSRKNK